MVSDITLQESILNTSRLTPSGDGKDTSSDTKPTSAQKWWASIIIGLIFFIVSSPLFYLGSNTLFTKLGGAKSTVGPGPTLVGLVLHTIIFILIVRAILW